ncbi:hypothetical protein HU200_001453 [Digitaria exilis]|uniref:RING-type E3 ubiquitin transferase n=1 Tax=Digitaria exilis TaxID=1010633 RepID=A0A835FZI2_9POAL|nr:hypothetical protein HU200_001453 [Digitaria exilis]
MPPRSRDRGRPVVLDDLFEDVVEIDHGEEDDSEEEEDDEGGEETDDDQGSEDGEGSSEEEEEEDEEGERHADFAGGDCGPSAQARVSGAAADCPVCMDPWTSQGPHRIRSCLERWLTQRGSRSATCPQCGKRFKQKDIINLYAPEVAIPKNELEKVLQHDKLFEEMTKRQIAMEQTIKDAVSSKRQVVAVNCSLISYCVNELVLDGARVIAIDASSQIILASGRAAVVGAEYALTKVPGWSCSADVSGSHHIYAGLQNGMLLIFDIRLTTRPLHSMVGLSTNPIHTLHSVVDNNGSRKILSASALGPCMWDADDSQNRPHLLAGTDNQRVCISLACAPPSSDVLVASFRPKVEASEDAATTSQVYLSQTPLRPVGSGKLGHHALIRRTGISSFAEGTTCYGNVSEIRMSRSAIIPSGDNRQEKLFAYGDESLRGVRTWQLPSFAIHSDLCPHRQPILDLRYAESSGGGTRYLGCLSDEKLQVFRVG